ncbi:MAG: TonB-dependent receptor [Muribaculaceae bacterium]|nr:TonB-dependent receptor [Muribaculaceae bacterium]
MRIKLLVLLLLSAALPIVAQTARLTGVVTEADTGNPVSGALVTLPEQGITVTTGPAGDFLISNAAPGKVGALVIAYGFVDQLVEAELFNDVTVNVGTIALKATASSASYYEETQEMYFDENMLENEDDSQAIATLTGSGDNVYYNTASYNFGPMYFRYRGYESSYQTVSINGIEMNDLIRGQFNFATLGGMTSRAFRNKTVAVGMDAASYNFGAIGGATNYNTITSNYAPGFNGSVAYTNSNYMLRGMATYSTGMSQDGWGLTVSAIGRWSDEGVVPGTFYKSAGLFLSLEKVFNDANSLTLTAFGAPTQRATGSATYQEVYDLTGDNLYNPNWGWQNGKKRSARIREQFDPTFLLNWIFKPSDRTVLNTGVMFRNVNYQQTRIERYKASDPMPNYYRYLPSYYRNDPEMYDYYTQLWETDESVRQINWDAMYQANYLNNIDNMNPAMAGNPKGASYILESQHSNQLNAVFNSNINHRINDVFTLQGGLSFNYTKASYYKTVKDLLGGEFWYDYETFSDQYMSINPDLIQNDLDHPDRKVYEGDKFGYNYDIHAMRATAWLQNMINLPQWDIYYGFKADYTQYMREGHMRTGRDPENSKGKGKHIMFDNAMFKAGATYKLDGRNAFAVHGQYGTRAPLADMIYLTPRYRAGIINDPQSERILSGDISYTWNYRRFRGSISAYATMIDNATERNVFYDDDYRSTVYYVLQDVKRVYKGVELGMAYKITPSLTATFAGTYSRSQYKNNPTGTRVIDNGMEADVSNTVYLRNYFLGSTPQTVGNLGLDWAAPKSWFFNINGTWMGDSYVNLSPRYHEAMPNLWTLYPTPAELEAKIAELAHQDKLSDAFVLNLSVGKLVYINRKVSMNFNVSVNNVLNNRNIVTYAYEQSRLKSDYDRSQWPARYTYAQGTRVFVNVGIRF